MNKKLLIFIMLLISTCAFSQVKPPTNKSVHGIVGWVEMYFMPIYPKSGVFAYLTSHDTITTITLADTWYFINGTFGNIPIEKFSFNSDPSIVYDGDKVEYFEIDWHSTMSSNKNTNTVHCGIKKNGIIVDSSIMGTFLKNQGQQYTLSGTTVIELKKNDTIQLVFKSDKTVSNVTFYHYTTTIRPFF